MAVTINNIDIFEMELTIPICGRPVGSFTVNSAEAANYKKGTTFTLKNEDASYSMFVSEFTGEFFQAVTFKAFGGSKDITAKVAAKSWNSNIPISDPIKYVLQQTGLSLSNTSDQTILNKRLDGWNIISDAGDIVLKNILNAIPDSVVWQILPDGSFYVGPPKFSDAPKALYYNVQEEHPELGSYTGHALGLGLRPGMIINLENGKTNITNVEYQLYDGEINFNVIGV